MKAVMLSVGFLCAARAEQLAFVAGPRVIPEQARLLKQQPHPTTWAESPQTETSGNAGTLLLVGACLGLAALGQSRKRSVARRVWEYVPNETNPEFAQKPFETRVPSYLSWINLRNRTFKPNGRKMKRMRSQKILTESNVWWGSYIDKWHVWYPDRDKFNLYKGPDSHPNNPHFPGASNGLHAQQGWAAAPMAASPSSRLGLGAALCGGSAKRLVRAQRVERAGIVLKAHKKAASSTKNHGRNNCIPQHYGLKRLQGNAVKAGSVIATQKGNTWYAGENVKFCRDHRLVAAKDGILQFRGIYKHKEAFVVPWEYIRSKCNWYNSSQLAPNEYEPWMGVGNYKSTTRRKSLIKLRAAWEETPEGIAHLAKKTEKKEKQREIQLKIRAHKKLKRKENAVREKELAGASDSEKASE